MYESNSQSRDDAESAAEACGGTLPGRGQAGSEPAHNDTHGKTSGRGTVVDRLSRYGMQVFPAVPSAFQRRSRLQRQQEVSETSGLHRWPSDASERGSLTPAMRKKYLQDLLLNDPLQSGFSRALSRTSTAFSRDEQDTQSTGWALYPMEHAWMLSAVDGNYETILEFVSDDPHLLTRKDFVSGFSVLHWLAKRGQDETLIKLLRHAENKGIPVNVNLKGSGGFTPLHVATMHSQYMVIKLLVGALGANIDVMDYSGKRAWQYLEGNAPEEMKELLGTWDDEYSSGCAHNANNNASSTNLPACEADGDRDEVDSFDRNKRTGSWRFGSFKRLLSPFSFLKNKS